ncbi:MAG: DALR domain-containing protein, partial [Clostridia bacterium]
VSVDEQKESPLDFALWKAQKPGEPAWESPWGMGRPGWHIECSAMSTTYLGETFDIHGGGKDLLFPHHENEIAQTSGATGKPYVHYWMHNGFLNIDNEKMSKSAGNFFTVRDIAKEFDLEAVRMFTLSAQYRSPLNFSREQIEQAQSSLERLYIARDQLAFLQNTAVEREPNEAEAAYMAECDKAEEKFIAAMDDDLNTADALAALFEMVRELYKLPAGGVSAKAVAHGQAKLAALTEVLGLLMKQSTGVSAEVQAMVDERAEARKNRDWKRSDDLRDQIKAMGYILEDTSAGQKVRKGV